MVFAVKENRESRVRDHVERLCSSYWKPIYYYVRRVWSKSNADAKDLTQGFFVSLLEYDALGRFDPRRGNFRSYLKKCLINYLRSDARKSGRLKRGGGRDIVSLEEWKNVIAEEIPDPIGSPEEEFDQDWMREVLVRSVSELHSRLKNRGEATTFEAFRLHDLPTDREQPLSYKDLAKSLGITKSDVGNYLRTARRELRRILMETISEYAADEKEILAEESRILGELS